MALRACFTESMRISVARRLKESETRGWFVIEDEAVIKKILKHQGL
jgi:hypothetical protein